MKLSTALFFCCVYIYSILVFSSEDPRDNVQLTDLTIEQKSEKFKFNEWCESSREWIEFSTTKTFAVDKINRRIRKDMTVGRKLKASDCPEKSENPKMQESYKYVNMTSATGQMGNLLGINELVYFPGGTGRISSHFITFDLQTGKVFNLKSCLKSSAEKLIVKKYCETLKAQMSKLQISQDQLSRECKLPEYQFVIQGDGINIATWVYKARERKLAEAVIGSKDVGLYFKDSCLQK